jgi:hypothetical protein
VNTEVTTRPKSFAPTARRSDGVLEADRLVRLRPAKCHSSGDILVCLQMGAELGFPFPSS